jgi:N-acetylglucosaminyl-diphospho-decaprenol L-rhamnosyltransferase
VHDVTDMTSGVAVVIVTHNSSADIASCVQSIRADPRVGSITVIDSGSIDDTVAVATQSHRPDTPEDEAHRVTVRVVSLGNNVGFGAACNRGAAASSEPLLLFLNPDTVAAPRCVTELAHRLDTEPQVSVVGPSIELPDGTVYPSARRFPSLFTAFVHGFVGVFAPGNRWSQRYLRPAAPQWISGTALMVRRRDFERVGGFDESYFMYVEDVDLCWRLTGGGSTGQVAVVDSAKLTHRVGGSSDRRPYRLIVAHHRSLWHFARRTTHGVARISLPAVGVALAGRAGLLMFRYRLQPTAQAARHR